MRLPPFHLVLLIAFGSGWGCRAIHDDQETRPLPAPEPPAAPVAMDRSEAGKEEAQRKSASRPRSEPTTAAEKAPAEEAAGEELDATQARETPEPTSDPVVDAGTAAPPPAADSGRTRCLDQCRSGLERCVTGADGGSSLESCRGGFEACKSGCG